MRELMNQSKKIIFRAFRTHTVIKLLGLVLLGCALVWGLKWLPSLQIRQTPIPRVYQGELAASAGMVEEDAGEVLVAETDTRKLYLNSETLNLKVEDKATGKTWNAIHPEGTEDEKSLLKISYIGEDNTVLSWNSFLYSVKDKTYTMERIEGGVRINLAMKELDSLRVNEYVPQRITIEKYEDTFVKGLEEKAAQGVITPEEKEKYDTALSLTYARDEEKNCYYNRYSKAPPISVVNQLIQITKLLNYTKDQLMADNADFGISVDIVEPASFLIPVEAVLDGDDFIVRVPANQIKNENEYYTITRIEVLPYFGSVSPAQAAEGYALVPDGSGALLNLNEFNSNYGTYSRALYNNTYYNDYFYMNSYPESLSMPVFGMIYGKGETAAGGFLGIIDQGDETAFITAAMASAEANGGGGTYNRVYSSFDATQYSLVSIMGPYDSSGGKFMSGTGMMDIDYRICYKLYPEEVTYYAMARTYQDYLVQKYGLTRRYEDGGKLHLDVAGALTLEERLLGIAYHKVISMTSYSELKEIMTDLQDIPLVVDYLGVFDEGLNNRLMSNAEPVKANGSGKELKELLGYAKEQGQEIYLGTDFSRIYAEGGGFRANTHGTYDFTGYPAFVYGYHYPTGMFTSLVKPYNILAPEYLSSVVERFLKNAGAYDSLYIDDLAVSYYANYRKNKIVTPAQAQAVVHDNLTKLSKEKTLTLNNPHMNKIGYGKYAVNISRESSGYGGFAEEIPFRQLVMNGLISYTTLNVNEAGVDEDYFLLQALELGSSLKFTITAKSLDLMKNKVYSEFVSRQYSLLREDIKELYQRYEEAYEQIGSMEIADHAILADQVFETTYANGARVITNYNKYPVQLEDREIEALGYAIIRSKGGRD